MATPRAKRNITKAVATTDEVSPAELAPVELDGPDPAIARWQALADIDHVVEHEGDASKVAPFPRPAWADPKRDMVGTSFCRTRYRSALVEVVTGFAHGLEDGTCLEPATARIQAVHFADGTQVVHFSVRSWKDDDWRVGGVNLSRVEATGIAEALLAAVDLIGSEQ